VGESRRQRRHPALTALKWLVRLVVWSIGVAAGVTALAAMVLQTGWGRERLRRVIVRVVSEQVDGSVAIDKLRVGLDGHIELDGVSIVSHDVEVVRLRHAEVDWVWLPLLLGRVHITTANVDGLDVRQPAGPLLRPKGESSSGGALDIRLDQANVTGWSFTSAGGTRVNGDAWLAARVSLPAGGVVSVEVTLLPSRVSAHGASFNVRGQMSLVGDVMRVHGVDVANAGAHLVAPEAVMDLASGKVDGSVTVTASADEVARRLPGLSWLGAVSLTAGVTRASAHDALAARLTGRAAGAQLNLLAHVPAAGEPIDASLQLSGFAPSLLDARVPRGTISGTLTVRDLRPASLEGKVDALLVGRLGGVRIDAFHLSLSRRGAAARGTLVLRTDQGSADAQATVRLPADGPPVIESSHLTGSFPDAALLAGRLLPVPVSGAAHDIDLRLSGTPDNLAVAGTAVLDHPRVASAGADSLALTVDLQGLPRRARGKVQVSAQGLGDRDRPQLAAGRLAVDATIADAGHTFDLGVDGTAVGPLDEIHARGRLRLGATTRVTLGEEQIRTRDVVWRGIGGEIQIDAAGGITVYDVALASPIARIIASGRLDPARGAGRGQARRRGEPKQGTLELQLGAVDIAGVERLLAPERVAALPLRGTLNLATRLTRQGAALDVKVDGSVQGFAWRPDMAPLDITADLDLAGGEVSAGIKIADGVGEVELTATADAPLDPTDAAAWRKLDPADALRSAKIAFHKLDLARTVALAGAPGVVAGFLDGTVVLPAHRGRVDELVVDLSGSELLCPGWRAPFDLGVAATWTARPGLVDAHLKLATKGVAIARLDGGVVLDVVELWHGGAASIADARGHAQLTLEKTPLTVLSQLGLARAPAANPDAPANLPSFSGGAAAGAAPRRLAGTVDATLVLDGKIGDPSGKLRADLANVVLFGLRLETMALEAQGDQRHVAASLHVGAEGGERLDAQGEVTRRGDDIGLEVTASARRLPLGFLRSFARDEVNPLSAADGRLDAEIALGGTLAAPRGQVSATFTDARFLLGDDIERIDHGALEVRTDGHTLELVKLDATAGQGKLQAHGTAELDDRGPARVGLDLTAERFSFLAGATVVEVTTDLHLQGQRGGRGWDSTATLRRTTVALPRSQDQGTLQPLGALQDVVFVDRRAADRAAREAARASRPVSTTSRLTIETPDEVHLVSPEVDATLRSRSLAAVAGDGRATLAGDVEVTGGQVIIQERTWDIRKAHASFDGSYPVDAAIDVLLSHDFDAATVDIGLSGTLRQPQVAITSTPGIYDDQQLLAIVMGGEPDDPGQGLASHAVGAAAAGLGANLVLGPVRRAIREVLPLDVLRLTVENSAATGDWQLGFQAGFHVTKDFMLTLHYRGQSTTATSLENVYEGTFEWNVVRHWLLEGRFGDQGIGGLDLLWSFRR
jgi:autotransporter translocation and assembly factor TamB